MIFLGHDRKNNSVRLSKLWQPEHRQEWTQRLWQPTILVQRLRQARCLGTETQL